MASQYDELADFIIENVGGTENIKSLTHCIKRLRFMLFDEDKANTEALNNHPQIQTVIQNAGQYQVVIGYNVDEVFEVVSNKSDLMKLSDAVDDSLEKENFKDKIVGFFTGLFN